MSNYQGNSNATDVDLTKLKTDIRDTAKAEFEKIVKQICSEEEAKSISNYSGPYSEYIAKYVIDKVENAEQEERLQMLYNHEKHFLDILKDYKEEIKFASSIQADVRKEQAQFFSSTLKEVCNALKETQIDPKFQVQWIFDLVQSYTSSLKISSQLAEEHVISLLGEIQEKADKIIKEDK